MRKQTIKTAVLLLCLVVSAAFATVRVTTTTTDLASLVEMIGGDLVDVTSLSRPLQDAHYLDATPGMIMRISRSDLFVENGFELEVGWVPEVLRETRNRRVRPGGEGYVNASEGIQAIQIPSSASRAQGDVHPSGNPHYTLEPVRAQQAARNIANGLIRVDGANRETYQNNLESFIEQSNEVVEKWVEKFKPYEGTAVLIYHKHFDYLLKKLGLNIADAIEPLPGLAPSAGHVARLLSTYDSESVRVVIMEPWHDQRVGRQVAQGIGVDLVVGCPTVGSCDGADCILTLFETNARKIYEAITGGN
ncbi:Zinc ABC transporter, periplasmic-binding protein ZnuA [Chitinispirillum alkaliphilum]|nr:Zinc ABC transporter, periplasmic-binding protein ZnuA [Chitinispirillum alkaliphilum]